jgi:hypothetical protein
MIFPRIVLTIDPMPRLGKNLPERYNEFIKYLILSVYVEPDGLSISHMTDTGLYFIFYR